VVILFPPSIYLDSISKEIKKNKANNKNMQLGIQNISPYNNGAYTGEVSVDMANDFGCSYILIGHSERRHIFMESEKFISNKISIAFQKNKKTQSSNTGILAIASSLYFLPHAPARTVDFIPNSDAMVPNL
jgi:triosephosphate isomerase